MDEASRVRPNPAEPALDGFHYREVRPSPPLRMAIECLWFAEGPASGPEHIIPDGCPELVVQLGAAMESGEVGTAPVRQPRMVAVGQRDRPLVLSATGRFKTVGMRLRPAWAGRVLGFPAAELTGRWASLDALFGVAADRLQAQLREARDEQARIGVLDRFLRGRLNQTSPPDGRIQQAVAGLLRSRGRMSVRELRRGLGVSERWLERGFAREVGLPPKVLAALLRIQSVLEGRPSDRGWAELAVEAGFYDQAHLVRDFSRYTEAAPAQLLRTLGPLAERFVEPERLRALLSPSA